MFKKIAVAATLALLATSSFAQKTNVYAGADFGTTKLGDILGHSSSFGAFVGYQFTPMFAVEANTRRLGTSTEHNVDLRVSQMGISLVATKPINSDGLNVFGRVGYSHLKATVPGESETESGFTYGVGMSYAFTPVIAGRVEFQKVRNDVNNVSAGVVFKF
jgi:opacity protein-like surface antigen